MLRASASCVAEDMGAGGGREMPAGTSHASSRPWSHGATAEAMSNACFMYIVGGLPASRENSFTIR